MTLPNAAARCDKLNVAPTPVNNLAATVTGSSTNATVSLTWTDTNNDGTGYIVQRTNSATSTFATVATLTSATPTSFTDSGLKTGSYQYRVLATNAYGNSMSISVIQVMVP